MQEDKTDQAPAPESPSSTGPTREDQAVHEIYKYAMGSFVAGMIPAPGIDLAAVTAIQIKMLHSISNLYSVPFSQNAAKSVVVSLFGGLGATAIARGTFGSLVKAIPLVGPLAGPVVLPAMAVAATYAVGRVFIRHFESGGTFLDFDSTEARTHFNRLYSEGKALASDVARRWRKGEKPAETETPPSK